LRTRKPINGGWRIEIIGFIPSASLSSLMFMKRRPGCGLQSGVTDSTKIRQPISGFRELRPFGVCESLKPPLVCYGSDKLRIYIHYDANSRHELDLVLMSRDDTSPTPLAISMGMLVRLRNPGNPETFEPAHPTHDESLKFEVARLAKLLKEHGSLLLEGNMSDFLRVEELEARLAKDQKRGTR
jgi:hypothetical protein